MQVTTPPSAGRRLTAYLNDHLTDETLGIDLAGRAGAEHKGTQLGTFLELLSWELEEDRETLVELMGELGAGRNLTAIRAAIAETMRSLRLRGSSLLSTLGALESLDLRINKKLDLWVELRPAIGDRVEGFDFDEQIRRAERQAEVLEQRRLSVAADALS